uniref:Small heat shock protein 20.4 n=1 Tax=Grapholita molesta TaxID=192188 RepID=A0A0K0XQX6_GRAMO|nr:small heat shock protein 20.4 [Grapholita molesta]
MEQLETAIGELMKHFPAQTTSGLQGSQYKININLNGFDEKEITVKAREGLVMVQAIHKSEDGGERNYLDVRSLPTFVKAESGSWTYDGNLLKVVFDVKESSSTTEVAETTESVEATQAPDREEIESQENDNTEQDADVGVRGDTELISNEIPKREETVEATTYAVNYNNDVEFVPVRLNENTQ